MHIRVFPDYQSTGLWHGTEHYNMDPNEIGLDGGLLIALKYWHWVWEFLIVTDCGERCMLSASAVQEWKQDGKRLVDALSERYDGVHTFEYHNVIDDEVMDDD